MRRKFGRSKDRSVPELNTTSTADISFMLLIFFLVTSSMDSDKVLRRQMPPLPQEEVPAQEVDMSKVITIAIGDDDSLRIDQQSVSLMDVQQRVEAFIAKAGHDEHIVKLDISPNASYDTYFQLQNSIVLAYRNLRDERAKKEYGHSLSKCSTKELQALAKYYPQRIAEGGPQ